MPELGIDQDRCAAALSALGTARNRQAFGQLYDILIEPLYGIALTLCHCHAKARTVCTQVFSHIYTHADDYDPDRCTVAQWTAQLTHRYSLLAAANQQAANQRTSDLLGPTAVGLSGDQRHALAYAYFAGLTHREIAHQRHTDPQKVSESLRGGLRRL